MTVDIKTNQIAPSDDPSLIVTERCLLGSMRNISSADATAHVAPRSRYSIAFLITTRRRTSIGNRVARPRVQRHHCAIGRADRSTQPPTTAMSACSTVLRQPRAPREYRQKEHQPSRKSWRQHRLLFAQHRGKRDQCGGHSPAPQPRKGRDQREQAQQQRRSSADPQHRHVDAVEVECPYGDAQTAPPRGGSDNRRASRNSSTASARNSATFVSA